MNRYELAALEKEYKWIRFHLKKIGFTGSLSKSTIFADIQQHKSIRERMLLIAILKNMSAVDKTLMWMQNREEFGKVLAAGAEVATTQAEGFSTKAAFNALRQEMKSAWEIQRLRDGRLYRWRASKKVERWNRMYGQ